MVGNTSRWVAVLFGLTCVGVLASSSCRIQLCKGSGCGGVPDVGGWGGDNSGAGGGFSGGAAGVEDPLLNADPVAVNRQAMRASAAAYLLQGTVDQAAEVQGIDPETVDTATVQQLIDTYMPGAVQQADAWLETLDPSVFDAEVYPAPPECHDMGCPAVIKCDSAYYNKQLACSLQACGDGRCKPCPDWFGPLKNLIIRAWCSYVCFDGSTVVGSAALVITRPFDTQVKYCIVP